VNYRHAFHAGNFADVHKHAVLARLIEYLKGKAAAFRVLDTHAGIGRYDLHGSEAQRSPEWLDGIKRLTESTLPPDAAAIAEPYLAAVRATNKPGRLAFYPGSPLLARTLMRPQDRLSALELHPTDAEQLSALFAGDHQVRVTHLDGWLSLNAHLPPKERRGLVLVDPPFEEGGEFGRLVDGLVKGHGKWATGMFALWYPIKEAREVNAFVADLKATGIPKILRTELMVLAPATPARLYGSGLIVVNPPFTLEAELQVLLPALAKVLGEEGRGNWRLEWIRGES